MKEENTIISEIEYADFIKVPEKKPCAVEHRPTPIVMTDIPKNRFFISLLGSLFDEKLNSSPSPLKNSLNLPAESAIYENIKPAATITALSIFMNDRASPQKCADIKRMNNTTRKLAKIILPPSYDSGFPGFIIFLSAFRYK